MYRRFPSAWLCIPRVGTVGTVQFYMLARRKTQRETGAIIAPRPSSCPLTHFFVAASLIPSSNSSICCLAHSFVLDSDDEMRSRAAPTPKAWDGQQVSKFEKERPRKQRQKRRDDVLFTELPSSAFARKFACSAPTSSCSFEPTNVCITRHFLVSQSEPREGKEQRLELHLQLLLCHSVLRLLSLRSLLSRTPLFVSQANELR